MKIYLVIESVDVGPGFIPSIIHGIFKSKENAEKLQKKVSEEIAEESPYWLEAIDLIRVEEMELQE
jgi:hypothetical protein